MADEGGGDKSKFGDKETDSPNIDEVKRGCTDCICFILFVLMWIAWIMVAMMAVTDGCPDNCNNPMKLVYGFDTNGCMCGADCTAKLGVDNTGKYNMYIPDPREPSKRLCLSKCPTAWGFEKAESTPIGTYMCAGGNCDVEGKDEPQFYIQRTKGDTLSNDGMLDNCFIPGSNSTDCWFPTYPTQEALHKCVPMLPANLSESDKETLAALGMPVDSESFTGALAFMTNPAGEIGQFTAELALTWPVVAASVGIALIMGFVWMLLIRWFAMIMLYITTVALFLILGVVAIFAWDKTGKIKIFDSVSAQTGQNVTALIAASGAAGATSDIGPELTEAIAWIFTILFAVYFVLMFFFFKRIVIAIKVIREAAKAMAAMPTIVLQPLITLASLIVLYVWAAAITMYLVSAGEFDPTTGRFTYSGGTCTDLVGQEINATTSATLLTLQLAVNVLLRNSAGVNQYSLDAGNSWTDATFTLSNPALQGQNCTADRVTSLMRCSALSNTSSTNSLPIGSCLADMASPGSNCTTDALIKDSFASVAGASGEGSQKGQVAWNSVAGTIGLNIADNVTVGDSAGQVATTVKLSMHIRPCSDNGTCTTWNFNVSELVTGVPVDKLSWKLESKQFFSTYNLTYTEVVRACNTYGSKEKALPALLQAKRTGLVQAGMVDMNELPSGSWGTPTIDNWKSFLPVTLDGNTFQYMCIYHLFMFLWTNNFTVSSAYFILCGSVASWYWTEDKKTLKRPIIRSTYRYVRYHMGTVCVGSFIIAVVQLIRILFNYFVNRCERFKDNPLVKALVCIVNCCLWCLEKVIGYINKNAYIMCATHGFSFCKAAMKGFMLLMRNIMLVAAINGVAGILLGVGKIFICLATLAVSYLISIQMSADLGLTSNTPILTLFICGIVGWFIGGSFMGTFGAATDTIFLSFLHDQECNNGKDKPYRMADSLQSSLGVSNNKVTPADG